MQETIIQLKSLGQMPDSLTEAPSEDIVNQYDDLLTQVTTPLTLEEVEILISIFPESTMYEVEWAVLHLVETYFDNIDFISKYKELVLKCPSEEWKDTMNMRLDNWKRKKHR